MHWQNRLGFWADRRLKQLRIHILRDRVDIDQHGVGAGLQHRRHLIHTGVGDGNHLIAGTDNELADRWLVRPDKDAHALVIVEEIPGTKFDVEVYTDAVIAALKNTAPGANVLSREPMRTSPNHGRLLHVNASMSGMELEYYYGVYVQGERGFQVIAWASKDFADSVREDMVKICEGFTLPPN